MEDTALAEEVSMLINRLVQYSSNERTVLIGHSAGGFGAILVGSKVPNSRAIAINPQTVVAQYLSWTVDNLYADAFPGCGSREAMLEQFSGRLDLREAMKDRVESSSFTLFAHRADTSSFASMPHFPLLAGSFGLDANGGVTDNGDALVPCDWELNGISAHVLPGTSLPFIDETLGEAYTFDLGNNVSGRWYQPDF